MKRLKNILFTLALLIGVTSCGQVGKHTHKQQQKMTTVKITNEIARKAIQAWQDADMKAWNTLFIENPTLLDDGNSRDFQKFSKEMGAEYFISIDRVKNKGKDVYGQLHSDTWGDFKTYWKFTINKDDKISTLEIGQADY